jgi:hypothetical protein
VHKLYEEPDFKKYLVVTTGIEVSERLLKQAIQVYEKKGYGMLLICQKKTDLVIGYCKIKNSPLDPPLHIEM